MNSVRSWCNDHIYRMVKERYSNIWPNQTIVPDQSELTILLCQPMIIYICRILTASAWYSGLQLLPSYIWSLIGGYSVAQPIFVGMESKFGLLFPKFDRSTSQLWKLFCDMNSKTVWNWINSTKYFLTEHTLRANFQFQSRSICLLLVSVSCTHTCLCRSQEDQGWY